MALKILIITIFCILQLQPCYASENIIFTVGVQAFKEYLPYSEYKDGKYTGFNREILDLFASTKGYTFKYRAYPIKRLYREYLQEKIDLKYPDNSYWSFELKKEKDIKYSDPVVEYIDGVMILPENKGKGVNNIKNLGVLAGFTPFAYLKMIKTGAIKKAEIFNYERLLRLVILKRVDGAYSNVAVSHYYLDHLLKDRNALVFDPDLPHTRSHRHLSSFKHPKIIDEFNIFLREHHTIIKKMKMEYKVEDGILEY